MSSPYSNLKRTGKVPLPSCARKPPIPSPSEKEEKETDKLTDEVATDEVRRRSKSQEKKKVAQSSKFSSNISQNANTGEEKPLREAPSDKELMSLMMARISVLETKVYSQSKELIQKSRIISQLEEKLRILEQKNDDASPAEMAKLLKMQCVTLQKQVQEMEDFLYDYGLVWVGEAGAIDEKFDSAISEGSKENHVWRPGESVVSSLPKIDYDVILQKIKELNILVGDGVTKIEHTKDGARLKYPDPVQLTLYKNGILMFDGPFRPFSDLMTRQCLYDIMEGYFPSELQTKFPDGVPFKVTDKREVYYEDTRYGECFPGAGNTLDHPEKKEPSRNENLLEELPEKLDEPNKVVNERPGPTLSVNQFVDKLPPCVIKNGKVIDIRQSVWSLLKDDSSESQISIINTEATEEMKQRLQSPLNHRTETLERVATIRVKSENGDHTYVLKMKPQETIGDLRKYLDEQRKSQPTTAYEILSTFPRKVLSDTNATIQDCGLTPGATLYLKVLNSKT